MKSLNNFLDPEGRLVKFPSKRPLQMEALTYLAKKFSPDREYTERELYDRRFLDRDPYGRSYRLEEDFRRSLGGDGPEL